MDRETRERNRRLLSFVSALSELEIFEAFNAVLDFSGKASDEFTILEDIGAISRDKDSYALTLDGKLLLLHALLLAKSLVTHVEDIGNMNTDSMSSPSKILTQ